MRSTLPVAAEMHPSTRRHRKNPNNRTIVRYSALVPDLGAELDKRSFEVLEKLYQPRCDLWVGTHVAIWVYTPVASRGKTRHEFSKNLPEHLPLMVDLDLVKLEKIEDPDYPDTDFRFVKLTRTGIETLRCGKQRGSRVVQYVPEKQGMAVERHQWGQ